MDIIIRNLDPSLVKKIDEMAVKQKISRQLFLKNLLENFAVHEKIKTMESDYQNLVASALTVIEQNTKIQKQILDIVNGD